MAAPVAPTSPAVVKSTAVKRTLGVVPTPVKASIAVRRATDGGAVLKVGKPTFAVKRSK